MFTDAFSAAAAATAPAETLDSGKVRLGMGFKACPVPRDGVLAPPAARVETADPGKVRVGLGFKVLALAMPPIAIADSGKVRTGMGFKVFSAAKRTG